MTDLVAGFVAPPATMVKRALRKDTRGLLNFITGMNANAQRVLTLIEVLNDLDPRKAGACPKTTSAYKANEAANSSYC